MVNFGIHRGQAVSPSDQGSGCHVGEVSRESGAIEHLERAGWRPEADPLLASYADLPPLGRMARGYGSKVC